MSLTHTGDPPHASAPAPTTVVASHVSDPHHLASAPGPTTTAAAAGVVSEALGGRLREGETSAPSDGDEDVPTAIPVISDRPRRSRGASSEDIVGAAAAGPRGAQPRSSSVPSDDLEIPGAVLVTDTTTVGKCLRALFLCACGFDQCTRILCVLCICILPVFL